MENIRKKTSQLCNNVGVVTKTLNKELEDLEGKNIANSVVKMHFINRNYNSNSDSTELNCCDSETSIESSEYDRRLYETRQWQSNLFHYQRSNNLTDLNRRVQLKFQPLKQFSFWKPLQVTR